LQPAALAPAKPVAAETREAWFGGERVPTPVYRRSTLTPGATFTGPAVIEEKTSTTVLYPGQRARVDEWLNLEIDCEPR
jgi:N-methylhydantoinase A